MANSPGSSLMGPSCSLRGAHSMPLPMHGAPSPQGPRIPPPHPVHFPPLPGLHLCLLLCCLVLAVVQVSAVYLFSDGPVNEFVDGVFMHAPNCLESIYDHRILACLKGPCKGSEIAPSFSPLHLLSAALQRSCHSPHLVAAGAEFHGSNHRRHVQMDDRTMSLPLPPMLDPQMYLPPIRTSLKPCASPKPSPSRPSGIRKVPPVQRFAFAQSHLVHGHCCSLVWMAWTHLKYGTGSYDILPVTTLDLSRRESYFSHCLRVIK